MKRKMRKMTILTLCLGLSLACKPQPVPSDNGKTGGEEVMTDVEMFESFVLKSDLEALPEGTLLDGAEVGAFCTELRFSNGKTLLLGKRWAAYVAENENGELTINGKGSGHKAIDYPLFTISAEGNWLKQGSDTGDRAIPAAPPAEMSPGTPYVRYIRKTRCGCTAFFSDGTSLTLEKIPAKEMYVRKSATQMDVFIGEEGDDEFIRYPFKKREKAWKEGSYPAFLDNWGIMALTLFTKNGNDFTAGADLFLNGEAEMAVQVTDGRNNGSYTYVGGTLHGFENILTEGGKRRLTITVDGQDIPEDGTLELRKASKIVMTQHSELCQAYTNTNPFATAFRTWTFENGRLTIRVELKLLRDMYFNQAMFGMMCVLRRWQGSASNPYLTCWAVKDNDPLKTIDVSDGWGSMSKDTATSAITEYGEKGWSFALCVDEGTRKGGGMMVGTNGNAYNKIYFDLTGKYEAKAGETLIGQVHWEIGKTK